MMRKVLFMLFFPILSFSQDTIVKPQHSIISLDKLKVVYRGIDNPITVAVPNAKEYWISGPGVSKTDEFGKYIVRPGSGTELKIIVAIKLQDDSIVKEEHIYQIKGLPSPTTTLKGEFSTQGFLTFKLESLKDAEVGIKFIDFLFTINLEIIQFTIEIPNGETLIIKGNTFNKEALDFIKKGKNKDYIIINNIKANYMVGNALHKPIASLVFKIVK